MQEAMKMYEYFFRLNAKQCIHFLLQEAYVQYSDVQRSSGLADALK